MLDSGSMDKGHMQEHRVGKVEVRKHPREGGETGSASCQGRPGCQESAHRESSGCRSWIRCQVSSAPKPGADEQLSLVPPFPQVTEAWALVLSIKTLLRLWEKDVSKEDGGR